MKKKILTILACFVFVFVGGFALTACGDEEPAPEVVTDVTQLFENGVVDQAGYAENDGEQTLNNVNIIFRKSPTDMDVTYQGEEIEMEMSTVEDYDGPDSGVTVYNYLYEFETPVDKTAYDANPITIRCTVDGTTYECTLTTDLTERMFGF